MQKQHILFSFILLLLSASVYCQEQDDTRFSVLEAPEDWPSELLKFPLSFAPSLNYTGVEDLRFFPNWSDSTSLNFWSYAFVWYVDENPNLSELKLEAEIEAYYNGLMRTDNSMALFLQKEKTKNSELNSNNQGLEFVGKVNTKDAFFTQKELTLHIKVQSSFCSKTQKYLVLFYISPKEFDSEVWDRFDGVSLLVDCED